MTPPIRRSPLFAEAFDAADWIGGYAPRSKAHRDIMRLARSIIGRLSNTATAEQANTARSTTALAA